MESPLPPSRGHHNEEPYNTAGLQTAEGHEGEQPQEKKSVLGRVKARAKKIRDSLTKQGHSNDQEQDHDEEDNDEDDKEMVQDPEVPGAPTYDSASVTAPTPPTGVNSGLTAPAPPRGVNSGLPKGYSDTPRVMKDDRSESIISEPTAVEATREPEDEHVSFSRGVHVPKDLDPIGNVRGSGENFTDPIGNVGGREGNFSDPTGNENFTGPIGNVGGREENFTNPIGNVGGGGENLTNTIGNAKGGGENLGDGNRGSMGMEEDPHSLWKDVGGREENFTDPIGNVGGREESLTDPIGNAKGEGENLGNLGDGIRGSMGMEEDPHSPRKDVEGREENFTDPIENVGGRGENLTDTIGNAKGGGENLGNLGDVIKGSTGMEEDPHSQRKGGFEAFTPSNDQTKVSDPTGTGEEVEITPILHSLDKMNISNEPQQKTKLEPKLNLNTASHDQFSPESTPTNTPTNPHEPVPKSFSSARPENSPLDHLTENPSKPIDRLTENPSNQSSYAQMFSSAAASAKNAVASSLGYGGTEPERHNEMQEEHPDSAKRPNEMQGQEEATKPVGVGAADNAQKIASTVTEKLGPVAGAGSTVMSKVRGDDEDKHASDNIEGGGGPYKGVSEKLRPGDEDKELSEVISGALTNKGKEGGESNSGVCEVVSDAVHKRAPEDDGEERRPMGKVTESKAVAERLGTGEEGVGAGSEVAGGGAVAGKGMVGMIKGTVSSWLGKGSSESQTSHGTTYDGNQGTASGEAAHEHGQDDVGGTRPRDSSI